ncbi:hypothetical protein CEXT_17681 [Caerostris extrusa]|uniref:Ycf15 n=1 Tax=Caerostris extrusa TaxID=172846 RepID=A0AAV4XKF6_CAEEX|nr:hypothetical protein CEXT_17681 [Caerostris extrusa]
MIRISAGTTIDSHNHLGNRSRLVCQPLIVAEQRVICCEHSPDNGRLGMMKMRFDWFLAMPLRSPRHESSASRKAITASNSAFTGFVFHQKKGLMNSLSSSEFKIAFLV